MSIKSRLTISFTAIFSLLVIALAFAAYLAVRTDSYQKLDAELQVAVGSVAMSAGHELNEHSTKGKGEQDLQEVLDQAAEADLAKTQILVREENRNAVYKAGTSQPADLRSIASDRLQNGATIESLRIAARPLPVPKFGTAFQIYAAQPVAPVLARIRNFGLSLLLFLPLGLGIAGFCGYLLATKALRPLKDLADTIESVTSSDLSSRVEVKDRADEIDRVGARFNYLLGEIDAAFGLQRRFMADASHQIRTPVAVALTACQVVDRDPRATLPDYRESLQIVENQLAQLRRIVEDMFFLSQTDMAALHYDRTEMYFDDAIREAARAARTLATAKRQKLELGNMPKAKCLGDEDLLKQAVLTLLDNAVKFTPEEGVIAVSLAKNEGRWLCSVTDNGRGISDVAQERIFERFFREERSGQNTPGAGLGLAIARSIVEKHGGHVILVESRPGRTTFAIDIPAEEEMKLEDIQANSLAVNM